MKAAILFALAVCASALPPPVTIVRDNEVNLDTRTCRIPDVNDLNVDPEDTPSPLTVNECLENGLQRDENFCQTFNCSSNCIIPDLDSRGCLKSCSCKTSGLWGDIMLTESDVAMLESNRAGSKQSRRWNLLKGVTNRDRRTVYVVYYTFASSISYNNRRAQNAIYDAIDNYYKDTCILFAPKPSGYKGDYIEFFSDRGCYSQLGRMGWGKQQISIGRGCEQKGTVMHEMMHAMGFWHEQMRPDRDNYVDIKWENIQDGRASQFEMMKTYQHISFGSSYDIGSIMQYGGMGFSKNGRPTIVDRRNGQPVEGQRRGFAQSDIEQIRAMYDCDNI